MGTVAADDVTQIKEGEELVEKANKKLNALKQKVRHADLRQALLLLSLLLLLFILLFRMVFFLSQLLMLLILLFCGCF